MDKDTLKAFLDGIDDNTKVVLITNKEEFEAIVAPNLKKSVLKRIGKWVAVCLIGLHSILTVWMTLHDHFPTYVPIAEVFVTQTFDQAQQIAQNILPTDDGLPTNPQLPFDYRYVDLGTGVYPLSSLPNQFNTGQYIHPSGQAYI